MEVGDGHGMKTMECADEVRVSGTIGYMVSGEFNTGALSL